MVDLNSYAIMQRVKDLLGYTMPQLMVMVIAEARAESRRSSYLGIFILSLT